MFSHANIFVGKAVADTLLTRRLSVQVSFAIYTSVYISWHEGIHGVYMHAEITDWTELVGVLDFQGMHVVDIHGWTGEAHEPQVRPTHRL